MSKEAYCNMLYRVVTGSSDTEDRQKTLGILKQPPTTEIQRISLDQMWFYNFLNSLLQRVFRNTVYHVETTICNNVVSATKRPTT